MNKTRIIFIVVLIALGAAWYFWPSGSPSGALTNDSNGITLYKSEYCGCCDLYGQYLKKKSGLAVQVKNMDDVTPLKDQYNIPQDLRSCHTVIVQGYFVEGHIPLEAITKLLTEKPDIAGIALPGMPSGSPGMPGSRTGQFMIMAIHKDGTSSEFMRI
ncbi:hypothetical protein HYX14_03095 [Candidatus Woesearchaeota archaeon]|nr:hypothetical protein [Candidatus Woesearchaeota archaeon]